MNDQDSNLDESREKTMVDLVITSSCVDHGNNGVICHSHRNFDGSEAQIKYRGSQQQEQEDLESSKGSAFPSETSRLTPYTDMVPLS